MLKAKRKPGAFTLVELLVVIAIIGILVGLLLPAVQAAREAARRSQCSNNLKQLSLGVLNYESAHGIFPVQKSYTCDQKDVNSKGPGEEEHRSWIVYILPYIEQQAMYDQMDFDRSGLDNRPNGGTVDDRGNSTGGGGPSNLSMIQQRLPIVTCPSDASNQELKIGSDEASQDHPDSWYSEGIKLAQGNYASSVGDHMPGVGVSPDEGFPAWGQQTFNPSRPDGKISSKQVRGVFSRSGWSAKISQITDGTSNTFMAGECIASICPWQDWGFHSWALTGYPMNDRNDYFENEEYDWDEHEDSISFRSRHPQGVHFAYCDGSVTFHTESMDFVLYKSLSTRNGGETLSDTQN